MYRLNHYANTARLANEPRIQATRYCDKKKDYSIFLKLFQAAAPFRPPGHLSTNPAVPFPNESSLWEIYINEAVVIDNELVKDWTSSLNFLLVFVCSPAVYMVIAFH
jgi:hypothetical protein